MIYHDAEELKGRSLSGETMSGQEFSDCLFEDCTIRDCLLSDCSFLECTFRNCSFHHVRSDGSCLRNGVFENCQLVGLSWHDFSPEGAFCEPLEKLENCFLKYCDFRFGRMKNFVFRGSELQECSFADCDLGKADFSGCPLDGTSFRNCDLRNASFRRAEGYAVDLLSNKLKGAQFSFPEAVSLLNGLGLKIEM